MVFSSMPILLSCPSPPPPDHRRNVRTNGVHSLRRPPSRHWPALTFFSSARNLRLPISFTGVHNAVYRYTGYCGVANRFAGPGFNHKSSSPHTSACSTRECFSTSYIVCTGRRFRFLYYIVVNAFRR